MLLSRHDSALGTFKRIRMQVCNSKRGQGQSGKYLCVILWSSFIFLNLDPQNLDVTQRPGLEQWGLEVLRPSPTCSASYRQTHPTLSSPHPFAPSSRLRHLFPTHSFITTLSSLSLLPGSAVCLQRPPNPCHRVTDPQAHPLSLQHPSIYRTGHHWSWCS